MVDDNAASIARAQKVMKWSKKLGIYFLANWCEDYLASFSDEKYDILEGIPLYKLFTGKESEAVYLGKILHVNHYQKHDVVDFRRGGAFAFIVEGKIGIRYRQTGDVKTDPLMTVFGEETHFCYQPDANTYPVCMEGGTVLLWMNQDAFKRFALTNKRKTNDLRLPDAMSALGTLNVAAALRRVPFFKKVIFENYIPDIANMSIIELYPKDAIIVQQGKDIDSFYFNISGFNKLGIDDDGGENTFKDRTPYDVLSNCVELPTDACPLEEEDFPPESEDVPEWKFRYNFDTMFGAMSRAALKTKKQKGLPDLYSYNTRLTRIPSRIISNHLEVNLQATDRWGASASLMKGGNRRSVFPKHLQDLIPAEDDRVLENFKRGNYEGGWMNQGRKKRVVTSAKKIEDAMIGPGSHFYSTELMGTTTKQSRFSVLSLDWSVYIRVEKRAVRNFLKLPGTRDVNYRYFKNLRRNEENQFEEQYKKQQRKNI